MAKPIRDVRRKLCRELNGSDDTQVLKQLRPWLEACLANESLKLSAQIRVGVAVPTDKVSLRAVFCKQTHDGILRQLPRILQLGSQFWENQNDAGVAVLVVLRLGVRTVIRLSTQSMSIHRSATCSLGHRTPP
jgi:hypothetical protein